MNPSILTEYLKFLNNQIISQELLLEYHQQANSMLEVLLIADLTDYSVLTIHSFLSGLNGILYQAKALNQELLEALLKAAVVVDSSSNTPGNTTVH